MTKIGFLLFPRKSELIASNRESRLRAWIENKVFMNCKPLACVIANINNRVIGSLVQRELSPKVTEGLFEGKDNPSPLSAELPLHRGA